MKTEYYAGWQLQPHVRTKLLEMCPPLHEEVRCEHITLGFVLPHSPAPDAVEAIVRGMYYDEQCQALLVQINDQMRRPDNLPFHITVSHVQGFPSALVGQRVVERQRLAKEIAAWPLANCLPFVRKLLG